MRISRRDIHLAACGLLLCASLTGCLSLTAASEEGGWSGPGVDVGCAVTWNPLDKGMGVKLLAEDMSATGDDMWGGAARATAGRYEGRWYWEVRIDALSASSPAVDTGVGVSSRLATIEGYSLSYPNRLNVGYDASGQLTDGSTTTKAPSLAASDVIGVALDAYQGRVYFRRNGEWVNGADPVAGMGGLELLRVPGVGAYYPTVAMGEAGKMTANFGALSFQSPPPAGFLPFMELMEPTAGSLLCHDPGLDVLLPLPAPMKTACEGFTSYRSNSNTSPELHVINVYDADPATNGTLKVQVNRSGAMVLVLGSYTPLTWEVTKSSGTELVKVMVLGYEKPTVKVPIGVPVEVRAATDGTWSTPILGGPWPEADGVGNGDTQGFLEQVELLTQLDLTSYGHCSTGQPFVLTDVP